MACTKNSLYPHQRNKKALGEELRLGSLAWLCWEPQEKSLNHTKSQLRYVHLKLLNRGRKALLLPHVPDEETGAQSGEAHSLQITSHKQNQDLSPNRPDSKIHFFSKIILVMVTGTQVKSINLTTFKCTVQ